MDFYDNDKRKFFKTERQFKFFFNTYKEYTSNLTNPPWPVEQLFQRVFTRLIALLKEQAGEAGEIRVALAMTEMLKR